MIPAKSRERKCSTCKHYQPSPLWRKGWCRNPLLYDRNTNHLVEADSLACNRTFIDYWEPIETPARSTTSPQPQAAKRGKPRIAPAVPIETVDAEGNRDLVIGNTPVAGSPAVARQPRRPGAGAPVTHERPPLALVDEYYDAEGIGVEEEPKVTKQMERVGGTLHDGQPITARQRIREARSLSRSGFLGISPALWVAGGIVALAIIVGLAAFFVLRKGGSEKNNSPIAAALTSPTRPAPTPTGFGDVAPTVPATIAATQGQAKQPTQVASVPSTIAVGGWVQVSNAKGLNVRSSPSTAGGVLVTLPNGATAHVVGGPQQANGYTWWQVDNYSKQDPTATGWCAGNLLKPTSAPSP